MPTYPNRQRRSPSRQRGTDDYPTVYRATATRDGRWWAVEIHGFPPNYAAVTQGRDLAEAASNARKATSLLLNVPADEIEIDLHVNEADEVIAEVARTPRDLRCAP
jgi:hypothetical protein